MKSFVRIFGVVAGMAALLVSCNKQEEVFIPEDKTVEMTIVASSDETKTVLGGNGTVTWSASGEQLAVMEVANGTEPTTAKKTSKNGVTTDEGATMTFGVSLNSKTATSFDYYALYPNSAYVDTPSDFTNVKVNLASTQAPTEFSFGPSADVLVAKPVTGLNAQPTELNLQFARVIAVGKMTIKNLKTTQEEKVKKITFTAAGKAVTGRSYIDFTNAKGVEYGYSSYGVDNVVLDYSGKNIAANNEMTAIFTCWPFVLKEGEKFSVVVETENYIFTKDITLEGKSLAFNVGRASAFNVSFSGIEGVKKETATYTVKSTSAVSVTGKAPSGSIATYSSTYTDKWQLTKGYSMTLTLSGYKGMIVKGITLSMKSNKSSGAGYLSVKAGSESLGSIGSSSSGVNFNHASWYGKWSKSYVDVKPTLSNTAYTIQTGENLVIVIGATANSLYCESFTIEYVADPSFVGGSDPVQLATPSVSCTAKTANSLTFSWDAVANASGYQVSVDGGNSYGSTLTETTYTWTGLTANTTKTLYVKAIGDGTNYTDSDAASAEGTTTAADANDGSLKKPFTAAEAITAIDTGGDLKNKHVKGVITEVTEFNSTYGSITYNIKSGEKTLMVYSGLDLGSAQFSSIDDLKVDDEVLVCGTLKKFGTTYEFDYNNYIVTLNGKTEVYAGLKVSGQKTIFTVGDEFVFGGTVVQDWRGKDDVDVTSSAKFSGYDKNTAGPQTITVTVGDESTTYEITVKDSGSTSGETTVLYTLDTSSLTGSNNSYAGNCDIESDGITWNVTGNTTINPWRIGGSSITNKDRAVYTKTAFSKALTSIDVTFGTASSITVNSCKIIYSTNADFTNSKEVVGTFAASSTVKFEAEYPANCYYKLILNVTVTNNKNKYVELKKIEFIGNN